MRTSVIFVAIGIEAVAAQISLADHFPKCALGCLNDVLATATTCNPNDSVCLCLHSNQYRIYKAAEQCVIDACGYGVAQKTVLPAAKPYCSAASSEYLATATSPLPTDTRRRRPTATAAVITKPSTTTSAVASTSAARTGQLSLADYFPDCSLTCINGVLTTATKCDPDDYTCLCLRSNQYRVYKAAEQCVIDACGYDVAQKTVLPAAKPYCSAATSLYLATATSPLPTESAYHRATTTAAGITGTASSAITTSAAASGLSLGDYFPKCSLDCINRVLTKATTCDANDSICLCLHSNQYRVYKAAEQCVIDACGYDIAQKTVLPAAKPYCSAATSAYLLTATSPLPTESRYRHRISSFTIPTAMTTGSGASMATRSSGIASVKLTTSTIYATSIYTVTGCAPEVSNCPNRPHLTTETIVIGTTVCPVSSKSSEAAEGSGRNNGGDHKCETCYGGSDTTAKPSGASSHPTQRSKGGKGESSIATATGVASQHTQGSSGGNGGSHNDHQSSGSGTAATTMIGKASDGSKSSSTPSSTGSAVAIANAADRANHLGAAVMLALAVLAAF